MNCPRDARELSARYSDETQFFSCGQCGGIWIPQTSLLDFLAKRGFDPPLVLKLKRFHPVAVASAKLECPLDEAKMVAKIHRMVEVDICSECRGIWLDAGELEKILGGKMSYEYLIENAIDDIAHFIKTLPI